MSLHSFYHILFLNFKTYGGKADDGTPTYLGGFNMTRKFWIDNVNSITKVPVDQFSLRLAKKIHSYNQQN